MFLIECGKCHNVFSLGEDGFKSEDAFCGGTIISCPCCGEQIPYAIKEVIKQTIKAKSDPSAKTWSVYHFPNSTKVQLPLTSPLASDL